MLKSPLAVRAHVVCNATYSLTAEDIDNLLRASRVTVEAHDQYGYQVEVSANETVTLEQVSQIFIGSISTPDSQIQMCSGVGCSGGSDPPKACHSVKRDQQPFRHGCDIIPGIAVYEVPALFRSCGISTAML